jgi:putative intracellular protease/amidase
MKEILYILLNDYADHEVAFISQIVNGDEQGYRKEPKYTNRIVAATMDPVRSFGGLRTLPDYTYGTMPNDYAALVLIGGLGWLRAEADEILPIVKDAIDKGKPIGAICNAASWMAKQGLLNNIRHTGNSIGQLKYWGGSNYTNEAGYVSEQAVCDGNIITANGSAQLEFSCELQKLLEIDTPEQIERYRMFYKLGLVELMKLFSSQQG